MGMAKAAMPLLSKLGGAISNPVISEMAKQTVLGTSSGFVVGTTFGYIQTGDWGEALSIGGRSALWGGAAGVFSGASAGILNNVFKGGHWWSGNYNKVQTSSLVPTHAINKSKTEMQNLLNDINDNGIIEPIRYTEVNGVKFIVDGHHRYYSAIKLGITDIPAIKVSLPYGGYKNIDYLQFEGKNPGYWKYMKPK